MLYVLLISAKSKCIGVLGRGLSKKNKEVKSERNMVLNYCKISQGCLNPNMVLDLRYANLNALDNFS